MRQTQSAQPGKPVSVADSAQPFCRLRDAGLRVVDYRLRAVDAAHLRSPQRIGYVILRRFTFQRH